MAGLRPGHPRLDLARGRRTWIPGTSARSKASSPRPGMTKAEKCEQRTKKCEAAMAVGALDPGVPYESRWAPYDRIHGPGQGQFPEGSIRPRGYMAPDARHSFATTM